MAQIRAFLELAYFVSGIVIAVAACRGLRQPSYAKDGLKAAKEQLRLATGAIESPREDMHTRSKREAVTLAAQQCEKFGSTMVPSITKRFIEVTNSGVELISWRL